MLVEVWSDVVCPWCSIGKGQLDVALADFEHASEVELVWRSFELDPTAPPLRSGDYAAALAAKYGMGAEQAREALSAMTARAAAVGRTFRFDRVQAGNTFTAHRLLHLAAELGVQTALKERLFEAYFAEGVPVGDPAALRAEALRVGLPADRVDSLLGSDEYADAVRAEESAAHDIGVTGVPFFVIDRRFAVPGAQPADVLLRTLRRAWDTGEHQTSRPAPVPVTAGSGADDACGPDACAV